MMHRRIHSHNNKKRALYRGAGLTLTRVVVNIIECLYQRSRQAMFFLPMSRCPRGTPSSKARERSPPSHETRKRKKESQVGGGGIHVHMARMARPISFAVVCGVHPEHLPRPAHHALATAAGDVEL